MARRPYVKQATRERCKQTIVLIAAGVRYQDIAVLTCRSRAGPIRDVRLVADLLGLHERPSLGYVVGQALKQGFITVDDIPTDGMESG